MRHVLTLVDGRVVFVAVVLVAWAAGASLIQQRRSGRGAIVFWSLLAIAGVLLMTIANRGVVVSDEGLRHDLTWWTRNWDDLVPLVTGATYWWHWWLNVALFVPVGLAWTILTQRPWAVLIAAFIAVVVIETLHATVLSGAGDPTDVIANMAGTAAGVGIASRFGWTTDANVPMKAQRLTSRLHGSGSAAPSTTNSNTPPQQPGPKAPRPPTRYRSR